MADVVLPVDLSPIGASPVVPRGRISDNSKSVPKEQLLRDEIALRAIWFNAELEPTRIELGNCLQLLNERRTLKSWNRDLYLDLKTIQVFLEAQTNKADDIAALSFKHFSDGKFDLLSKLFRENVAAENKIRANFRIGDRKSLLHEFTEELRALRKFLLADKNGGVGQYVQVQLLKRGRLQGLFNALVNDTPMAFVALRAKVEDYEAGGVSANTSSALVGLTGIVARTAPEPIVEIVGLSRLGAVGVVAAGALALKILNDEIRRALPLPNLDKINLPTGDIPPNIVEKAEERLPLLMTGKVVLGPNTSIKMGDREIGRREEIKPRLPCLPTGQNGSFQRERECNQRMRSLTAPAQPFWSRSIVNSGPDSGSKGGAGGSPWSWDYVVASFESWWKKRSRDGRTNSAPAVSAVVPKVEIAPPRPQPTLAPSAEQLEEYQRKLLAISRSAPRVFTVASEIIGNILRLAAAQFPSTGTLIFSERDLQTFRHRIDSAIEEVFDSSNNYTRVPEIVLTDLLSQTSEGKVPIREIIRRLPREVTEQIERLVVRTAEAPNLSPDQMQEMHGLLAQFLAANQDDAIAVRAFLPLPYLQVREKFLFHGVRVAHRFIGRDTELNTVDAISDAVRRAGQLVRWLPLDEQATVEAALQSVRDERLAAHSPSEALQDMAMDWRLIWSNEIGSEAQTNRHIERRILSQFRRTLLDDLPFCLSTLSRAQQLIALEVILTEPDGLSAEQQRAVRPLTAMLTALRHPEGPEIHLARDPDVEGLVSRLVANPPENVEAVLRQISPQLW